MPEEIRWHRFGTLIPDGIDATRVDEAGGWQVRCGPRGGGLTSPALRRANLALRGLMEAGIVVALAWWGVHAGSGAAGKAALGVGVPAVGFGFWGLVDFRQAGRAGEPLRFLEELLVTGLAALAWYAAGQHLLAWALVVLSVVHHALLYPLGDRLLKQP